jgi:hypothetical protein
MADRYATNLNKGMTEEQALDEAKHFLDIMRLAAQAR